MTKYRDLLTLAKEGKPIPVSELRSIREKLVNGTCDGDPYTLLNILGAAGDIESLPIVERYLDFEGGDPEDDGMVRRLALQIISCQWAMVEGFDAAKTKITADHDKYVRAAAATAIGFLGARFPALATEAAKLLLSTLQNEGLDAYTRESAYLGLHSLLKIPRRRWPATDWSIEATVPDPLIMEKAQLLAGGGLERPGLR